MSSIAAYPRLQPYAQGCIPGEKEVLECLARVYRISGDSSKLEQVELAKRALEVHNVENDFAQSQDEVNSYAFYIGTSPQLLRDRVSRFIALCAKVDKTQSQRIHALLTYAETLISHAQLGPAEDCLAAASSSSKLANKNEQARIDAAIMLDRVWIAETAGELQSAKQLLASLPDLSALGSEDHDPKSQVTPSDSLALRAENLTATLDLMSGDYAGAELHSRDLQAALDSVPYLPPDNLIPARLRDEFIEQHLECLLDRAHACLQLGMSEQAAKLLRAILAISPRGLDEASADASALLALCYSSTGHEGLAHAAREQAVHALLGLSEGEPTRASADAYLRLAICGAKDQTPTRVKRYLSSAKAIAESLHVEQTALYAEICERMN